MPGLLECVEGRMLCVGEVGPRRESCDCEDNDCDGSVDEPPDSGDLCPAGSACVDCQCAVSCQPSEFGFICPGGKAAQVQPSGECFCVAERCQADACGLETIAQGGETRCEPGSDAITSCVCKNNECTFPCEGVVCAAGTVCDPRDPLGRCVEDSCRGLGCLSTERCDVVTGICTADLCLGVTCLTGEACRDGVCEATCSGVICPMGETCRAGICKADACGGVSCPSGQACDPDDGSCVDSLCVGIRCPTGSACDPLTGGCEVDPCSTLVCPTGASCVEGECIEDAVPDAGVVGDGGASDAGRGPTRVLGTGGGGCACTLRPTEERQDPAGLLALLGLLGLALRWRRRRGRLPEAGRGRSKRGRIAGPLARLGLTLLGIGSLLGGCEVDPYCVDCDGGAPDAIVEAGPDAMDAGPDAMDAGPDAMDAGPDAMDAGPDATDAGPDGCAPEAIEICNGFDDNCDGTIDEGFDLQTSLEHCGACGARCAPLGAFGVCTAGVCSIASCDVGRHDLNAELADGCEYRCLPDASDDSLCDLRDNDCDGAVDEDADLLGDPSNCGSCGRYCRFPHVVAARCVSGSCSFGALDCEPGWQDIDADPANGCEYGCTPDPGGVELCNGRDDDCDGSIDEGDPEGGASCGSNVGACVAGVQTCTDGRLVCAGETTPIAELCNGLDDDCDGSIDNGNPGGGTLCGSSIGTCETGRFNCVAGALSCEGDVGGGVELCNGLDDDCDGSIDEGDPEGGTLCGPSTGACIPGAEHCRGGVLVCEGATGPADEICNGRDDDCDGMIDESDPTVGRPCGTDIGICTPGTQACVAGALSCVGATLPGTELCNGLDDDCDGSIDEGNPEGGTSCGTGVGACRAGAETCVGGALRCEGAIGASLEACNGLDDDCDGTVDNGFDLDNDSNNCGGCGITCSGPNAIYGCVVGRCTLLACTTGYFDSMPGTPGCEYACDFAGAEVCNGQDDDCDGATDEGLVAPISFCNPNGVCAGTAATCAGAAGWQCAYSADYEETEVSCDGLDNDCDGAIDEPFPGVGTDCSSGVGACRAVGVIACTPDGLGSYCTAPPPAPPAAFESCNNVDDDCDGLVDEDIPLSAIPTVTVPRFGGGTVEVMRYEASRPDASASGAGVVEAKACSNPNVLPWTNVTWAEANAACCALNASGTCAGSGNGWRLCDAADWQAACEGPSASCAWGYASSCGTTNRLRCNGEEHDCDPATTGDQDCLYPTADASFASCFADWGAGGVIY
ncbi:MAG: MopE-related protein, partial [Myxococcales bacterium]|nr:MopE-related protein [Myxococcales bacterium]